MTRGWGGGQKSSILRQHSLYTALLVSISLVMEFHRWWLVQISKIFGKKSSYFIRENHCILQIVLAMIVENKDFKKLKLYEEIFELL